MCCPCNLYLVVNIKPFGMVLLVFCNVCNLCHKFECFLKVIKNVFFCDSIPRRHCIFPSIAYKRCQGYCSIRQFCRNRGHELRGEVSLQNIQVLNDNCANKN
eukprot:NODE_363_length_8763_cov_0.834718.p10 type:complete len:102 gc:universal NODE_363_length_8763_cov_0.834718:5750-6055(+)